MDRTAQEQRPSPEALLRQANRDGRGRLKIFLGAAPGVGKTYEMLSDGAAQMRAGVDVVVAVVEAHGRAETEALLDPFEVIPRRTIDYRGQTLTEMDIDAVLERRPGLALVDELAHTNVEGSRHPKRWQDVVELLDAGIDVYTTLNIQHVESLNDVVASFTRVRVRETVPDGIFEDAEIEVVDLPPDELIQRLKDGKVYVPAEATRALSHFFSKQNLSALREMALRRAAQSVDRQMLEHLDANALQGAYAAGERVLVAISELPGSDKLVRAGKRLADALRAPWQVVSIETARARNFDDAQQRNIAESLRLAAGLGATIARIPADSVSEGLRAQIETTRATQLVLGKSRRSWWFELINGSVVRAMLNNGELAVHVIASEQVASAPGAKQRSPRADWGSPGAYLLIVLLIAVTTALGKLALPLIGVGGIDLLYLLPVIVSASRFGLRPGILSGLLASLAYNFFFLPPVYTFTIANPQSVLTMLILFGIAAFTSNLTSRLRSRAQLGVRTAQENASVAAFAQALARASNWTATASIVCSEIGQILAVNTVLLRVRDGALEQIAAAPDAVVLNPVDHAAAEWAGSRGEAAGAGTATLNAAEWQFHALETSLGVLAVLGIGIDTGRDPIAADRTVLLSTLLNQAALAHERLQLEDDVREVTRLKERDRLRAALLSSLGHDLRTPLTSVASAIEEVAAEAPHAKSLPVARVEIGRLRRFLDNLLDMVRIDTGGFQLMPEPIDLIDAVGAAVHDLKGLLSRSHIELKIPANLPLVRADPRLLHHILINLLANAVQHAGTEKPITIEGRRTPDTVQLIVRDRGPGLEAGTEQTVFETFAQGKGSDRSGGSGLGLAIVKGFAEAMQITVSASNVIDGGAAFALGFNADLIIQT
jgi:two-component system, OmpR family, sensor histidine kinase KdpD